MFCGGWEDQRISQSESETSDRLCVSGLREVERDSRLLSFHFFVIARSCFSQQDNGGVVSIAWYNELQCGWLGQRGQELVEEDQCWSCWRSRGVGGGERTQANHLSSCLWGPNIQGEVRLICSWSGQGLQRLPWIPIFCTCAQGHSTRLSSHSGHDYSRSSLSASSLCRTLRWITPQLMKTK